MTIPTMATGSDTIALPGGLVLRIAVLEFLLALEERGCVVRQERDGTLFVGPCGLVTAADAAQIRAHRDDLLALVDYCERLR